MNFTDLVQRYLNLARRKHPIGMHSAHEAYGVIAEELDEFWELVKKDGDKKDMLEELAHTAAMCQRAAEDLNLLGQLVCKHQDGADEKEDTADKIADQCRHHSSTPPGVND